MTEINTANIVILATDGYERSELRVPLQQLRAQGANVKIVSLEVGEIKSWEGNNWGDSIAVDLAVSDVAVDQFDALVLPGGQINPDMLRQDVKCLELIRSFLSAGKVVAAICHAPWLLIEADAVRGKKVTSYGSIKTDVVNAGGIWLDKNVVVDDSIITSRSPEDLDAFVAKIVEKIGESHQGDRSS